MNAARKADMPEPPDDADAVSDRTNLLNHFAWLQADNDELRADKAALQSECRRLMTKNAALLLAADKPPTEQQRDAAPPDVDDTDLAPGHPLRLRKIIEALKPTAQWLSVQNAAHRYGSSYENMRQLAKSGRVIWRREGRLVFILTASIDELLRSLNRSPNL